MATVKCTLGTALMYRIVVATNATLKDLSDDVYAHADLIFALQDLMQACYRCDVAITKSRQVYFERFPEYLKLLEVIEAAKPHVFRLENDLTELFVEMFGEQP